MISLATCRLGRIQSIYVYKVVLLPSKVTTGDDQADYFIPWWCQSLYLSSALPHDLSANMSTKAEGKVAVAAPPPIPPRIPESLVSVPDQRFYALALLGGLQAYKLSDAVFNFVQSLRPAAAPVPSTFLNPLVLFQWLPFVPNAEAGVSAYLTKWTALDSAALLLLLGLRIPGLRFGKGRFVAYVIVAWVIDALIFGKFEVSPSPPLQQSSKPRKDSSQLGSSCCHRCLQ